MWAKVAWMKNNAQPYALRNALAHAIVARRAKLEISQRQLAKLAGVRGAFIGGIETSAINVSLTNLQRLRAVLWPRAQDTPIKESLARHLLNARPPISQERLADISGVSISLIAAIERGTSNTSLDQVEAVASALGADATIWLELDAASLLLYENEVAGKTTESASVVPLRNRVGEELRKLRQARSIPQTALAEMLQVTKGHVSQIENAKINFSLSTIERFVEMITRKMDRSSQRTYANDLASTVRRKRVELNLTQVELAELSGLNPSLIGRIEREQATVQIDQVEQLAGALGVDGRELLHKFYAAVSYGTVPKKFLKPLQTSSDVK